MTGRFVTLLQREWLQHRRAWLLLMSVPPLLMGLLLALGRLGITVDEGEAQMQFSKLPPAAVVAFTVAGAMLLCFVLAWGAALIQAPGLARRDQQDRSIEFWLAQPVGHATSLAAPLLAHLLLFPLAAIAVGLAAGALLAPLMLIRFASLADAAALPWATIGALVVATAGRLAVGLVLATLWLSPIVLLVMAASAWLGRWGLPALVAALALLAGVFDRLLGNPLVAEFGQSLLTHAGRSFVTGRRAGGLVFKPDSDPMQTLANLPAWAAADALLAVQALADPLLAPALAIAALCFGLLVLRRRRGA